MGHLACHDAFHFPPWLVVVLVMDFTNCGGVVVLAMNVLQDGVPEPCLHGLRDATVP